MVTVRFRRDGGALNAVVSAEEQVFGDISYHVRLADGGYPPAKLADPAYRGAGYRRITLHTAGNSPAELERLIEAAREVARAAQQREHELRQLDEELANTVLTFE